MAYIPKVGTRYDAGHDQLAELKGESKGCDVADDAPKQRREPTQSTFLEGAAVPKNVGNQTDRFQELSACGRFLEF